MGQKRSLHPRDLAEALPAVELHERRRELVAALGDAHVQEHAERGVDEGAVHLRAHELHHRLEVLPNDLRVLALEAAEGREIRQRVEHRVRLDGDGSEEVAAW